MADQSASSAEVPGIPVTDLQYSVARTYVGVVSALFALSTLILALRLASRWKTNRRLEADDYLIAGAGVSGSPPSFRLKLTPRSTDTPLQVLGLVDFAAVVRTVEPVLGSRPEYLPLSFIATAGPLTVVAEIVSSWSVALLKTSIAIMLLRFQQARVWALFLYSVIGVQVATAVFVTIMQLTRCVPIQATWDITLPQDHCWSQGSLKAGLTVAAVLVIITDFIFALIPLVFLRHVRRSLRDRIIIGFLMSLGLFASAASVIKAVTVQGFNESTDTGTGLSIALWASIEAQVGIIAACIPCLRAPFVRLLSRLGISSGLSGGATSGDKSGWQGQSQPLGHGNSRSVRIHSTAKHGGFAGSRAVTKGALNDSEEDILGRDGRGQSVRRDRIEVKTDIDIELASVTANKVHEPRE